MYEELVKRLRNRRICIQQSGGLEDFPLLQEAADAIEDLAASVEGFEAQTNMVLDRDGNNTVIRFEPRWIPVTERLPEHGWYLAYGPTIKMEVLHFHSAEEVWSSERYYDIEVTHWMPLPTLPEENEHEP